MRNQAEDDVILSSYQIGNLTPRFSSSRVVVGHLNLTKNLDERLAQLEIFWDPDTTEGQRAEILAAISPDYIYQGTYEIALSRGTLIDLQLPIVFQENGVTIYQFDP